MRILLFSIVRKILEDEVICFMQTVHDAFDNSKKQYLPVFVRLTINLYLAPLKAHVTNCAKNTVTKAAMVED